MLKARTGSLIHQAMEEAALHVLTGKSTTRACALVAPHYLALNAYGYAEDPPEQILDAVKLRDALEIWLDEETHGE